jgi:hypothetical protein
MRLDQTEGKGVIQDDSVSGCFGDAMMKHMQTESCQKSRRIELPPRRNLTFNKVFKVELSTFNRSLKVELSTFNRSLKIELSTFNLQLSTFNRSLKVGSTFNRPR